MNARLNAWRSITTLAFGDGLRCAGGSILRLGTSTTSSGGEVSVPPPGGLPISAQAGITLPGTRTYQAWYRNSAAFCTPATFNLTNGWEIPWML